MCMIGSMSRPTLLILPVGFSRSGKTTLCKKIEDRFPGTFVRVDSDSLRDYLDQKFPQFRDIRVLDDSSSLRNTAAKEMQIALARVLFHNAQSLILDSCNQVRAGRQEIIATARRVVPNIVTVIIEVVISETQLVQTLNEEDAKQTKRGGLHATWVALYEEVQKKRFERPDADEADYLLRFDRTNEAEILERISKLL